MRSQSGAVVALEAFLEPSELRASWADSMFHMSDCYHTRGRQLTAPGLWWRTPRKQCHCIPRALRRLGLG